MVRNREEKERWQEKRENVNSRGYRRSEDITIRNMITRGTDAYLHLRPPRGCRGVEEDDGGAGRAR